jgi:hypothetical protein
VKSTPQSTRTLKALDDFEREFGAIDLPDGTKLVRCSPPLAGFERPGMAAVELLAMLDELPVAGEAGE